MLPPSAAVVKPTRDGAALFVELLTPGHMHSPEARQEKKNLTMAAEPRHNRPGGADAIRGRLSAVN